MLAWPVSCMMTLEITKLYILVSVWIALTFMQGFSCEKLKTSVAIFLEILQLIWFQFGMLSQTAGLMKLKLNSVCTRNIQGRELCWRDFMKYTFNLVLCWGTCEPTCFKLGMKLSTTKLHSLINSLNDLDVHSRWKGYGKANTCAVILL